MCAKNELYYGRGVQILSPGYKQVQEPFLLMLEQHSHALLPTLEVLTKYRFVHIGLFNRVLDYLEESTDFDRTTLQEIAAVYLGFPDFCHLQNTIGEEERQIQRQERLERHNFRIVHGPHPHVWAVNSDEVKKQAEAQWAQAALEEGTDGLKSSAEYSQYFFTDHPQYVSYLETLISEHDDRWLQQAAELYPAKLEQTLVFKSFGAFWTRVRQAHETKRYDFSGPGLNALKVVARALYIWSHRRYFDDTLMREQGRVLSPEYRSTVPAILLGNHTVAHSRAVVTH